MSTSSRPVIALCAHEIHDNGGMERAFAELIRKTEKEIDWIVVSSVLQHDLRPLVTWKRVPAPAAPAPLRFAVFWLLAGARLAHLPRDVLHTLGAITWAPADLVTVAFCHAAFAKIAPGLDARGSSLRRVNSRVHRAVALRAERFCFRPGRARMFGAVSPGVARELGEHYPGVPVTVTPNGVDTDRFRPDSQARAEIRAAHGVDANQVIAIFVGGEWGRKGLAVAIKSLAVAMRRPVEVPLPSLRLWIVGDGDPKPFHELARELDVERLVLFLGRRPDVERYLQAADIFVFPTSYETFSIASYEAAASELPVLSTPVSGIEDLIGADETGIAVAPVPEEVAGGLVRLAADAGLRRRLGTAGRSRAKQFSWERSAHSVVVAYGLVLGARESARSEPG